MGQIDTMLFRNGVTVSGAPAAAGDNTATVLVPASKRLKVLSAVISATGGVNTVTLKTGAVSRMVIGFAAGVGPPAVLPYNPAGWLNGALDEDLIVNLSAATAVQVNFTYILMDS